MTAVKHPTYHDLFQAMPFPCLVLRASKEGFVVIVANSSYLELTGVQSEDIFNKSLHEAFPWNPEQGEEGPAPLLESLEKVVRTGKRDCIEMIRYDVLERGTNKYRERYWKPENIPVLGKNGEVEAVLITVQEITGQIISERKERKLAQEQRHFIHNSADGLYALDVNGNFTSANEGLAAIAETPIEELLKMSFLPFCHPEDETEILGFFHRAISGQAAKFEARFISAKGRHMILEISLLPIRVKEKIEGAYGILKDVTSIRESQDIIVEKKNFLEASASFITNLLDKELDTSSLKEAFAVVGKAVAADRMYYFGAHTDHKTGETLISQQVEWTSEKATPQIENPEMQEMPASEVGQIMGDLTKNKPFTAVLTEIPKGRLREICVEQNIKSMLLLPIFLEDRLYGFIGFDDCGHERRWRQEEIVFLQSLAQNFTTVLEKRAAQDALIQQEKALVQSEKKFKALVQEGSDLIAILDLIGRYKFVSETSTAILGIRPEEFLGKIPYDFIHPEDRKKITSKLLELKKSRQVRLEPIRIRNSKGNWRWIETTATNLRDEPAVKGVVIHSRDITTNVNQAQEIDHINERYRLAATATQDLVYDWDLVTDKVERFHKTASFLGYYVADTNQRPFWREHVHPDEIEGLKEHLKATLRDPYKNFINTNYRFRRENGTYAHFLDRAYIIRDGKGKAIRLVGATSDISVLVSKKEELKFANQRFKMAMKATREMIWDWDMETDQVKRSKAFKKIYGYDDQQGDFKREYWMSKVHVEDQETVKASLKAAVESKEKKWRMDYRFQKANGDFARVVDRAQILRDKSGKAIRMVGAVLDVTASQLALERIEAQNRRLKEISWEQSHVLRAPLVRILGLLQLIKEETFEMMSYQETWTHIETSANELDNIIRRIVSKTEEMEEEPLNMGE